MRTLKTLIAAALLALPTLPLRAQIIETYNFTPNLAIPDGNATGVSDPQTISSAGTVITSIAVTLNIAGDFNGDLYLYLRHDSGLAVLLNRPGRANENSSGYDDHGFNVTFSDGAASDIHNYRNVATPGSGLQLTGTWQPDARKVDPATVLASDARSGTAFLNTFQGATASGQWTLFASDLSNGGTSQIQSWGMQLTVVPEPQSMALAAGAALAVFGIWRRLRNL